MRKVLVTGGSHSEIPLIKELKNLEYYVITTGNNTGGLGHIYADEYIQGDFSDREFILKLAKQEQVSGIVSGCNDFAYISTAYACEQLNLPGHDTYSNAQVIHHKDKFMSVLKKIGLRCPKTYKCGSFPQCKLATEIIKLPVIVKPIDLTGGKGVYICNKMSDLEIAYSNAMSFTRQDVIVVEEYIVGENHGGSFLVKDGKVVFSFFDNEQYYLNKYLVSGACYPANLTDFAKKEMISQIEAVFAHLNLVDGLFHTQFIVDRNGYPIIIDPCRRSPGDLYIKLVQYSTEVNYPLEIVKSELGLKLNNNYKIVPHNIARECIMTDANGKYISLNISNEIKNKIIHSMVWANEGEDIVDYLKYKAGILFFECDTVDNLYDNVNNFHKLVRINRG